ncbi:MAG: hypothetical protein L3J56_00495 [Bacteroidales bacterium]|nr:hypothetical protein [Bacteroidales bacterium]
MRKRGIIKTLGELFGKELSEELANEFQDEIDDFKKYLNNNKFIENIPNLELESYELKITSNGQIIKKDFKTKIEHKKVLGVFVTHRIPTNSYGNNRNSRLSIKVDRNFILAQGLFHYNLIEKTENLTIYEVAWRTDINVNTSDVNIEYHDGATVNTAYSAYVHFICQK